MTAARWKLRGATDAELLDVLKQQGAEYAEAAAVLLKLAEEIGDARAGYDYELECTIGILTARDIQMSAAKNNDIKGRVAAERLRIEWADRLQKHLEKRK